MNSTLILLYHDIIKSGKDLHIYDVGLKAFRSQMELLKVLMSSTTEPTHEGRHELLNDSHVMLTFDDGYRIWAEDVLEILKKLNLTAYFFVCIKNIQDASILRKHITTLSENGMIIGSHSVTHRFMHELSDHEVYTELQESKQILEDIIQKKVEHFSIPRGVCTDPVIRIAKEVDYKHVFTSHIGMNDALNFTLKRIAIRRNTSLDDFKGIVNGKGIEWMIWQQSIKDKAKDILGIKFYNQLRKMLIPRAEKKV